MKFWALLGMFVVFGAGYVAPLTFSSLFTDHPGWYLGLMLGGITLFVVGITIWGMKRKKMRELV